MVELQNFAEELYSFELKCGDKKSVFKDFVLKDLQPKIIKYTRKQKSPTFLFLKSSEDKNLLAYAIKYQMATIQDLIFEKDDTGRGISGKPGGGDAGALCGDDKGKEESLSLVRHAALNVGQGRVS